MLPEGGGYISMRVQLQIEERSGYLAASFIGEGAPSEAHQQFAFIAEHCKCANYKRLLIDFTARQKKVTIADRFNFGEKSQVFAIQNIKVAVLARPDQFEPQKFGELVARNRGVNLRGFTDVQAAEEWLLT